MENKWKIYMLILFTSYSYADGTTCTINDQVGCRYTIICEGYAGKALNPNCNGEPNVTFELINTKADVLTKGFFSATNFDSRVRAFRARNNTWTTVALRAFSYYPKIFQMDLSGNQIQEIQNEALKGILTLQNLNASFNLIETLYSNSLTTKETGQSDVEIIDLSNNALRYIASDAFNLCAKLTELYLHNNNITNLEDNVFSSLKNLTKLHLQNNKITALNMTLINLKELKYLDLSYNSLAKLSGYEIYRLTSLERVNMSNNIIYSIESNCFNQAFNLELLDLRNNHIMSTITNIMFLSNSKLSYLNFYNNNISRIQDNAFQYNDLLYLNLDRNFISGEITERTFSGLHKIKNLNICKQNISFIKANAFEAMSSLVNLNLSSNNIDVDQAGFNNTNSMVILDLSHNNITNINFLRNALTNLSELFLNNNQIQLLPRYAFVNQTRLTRLDVSYNRILSIQEYSLPLGTLHFLNVSCNPLTGSINSNVLSPGPNLEYLDLSNLKITRIENMALVDLPALKALNISYNVIEFIGQKNFMNMDILSLDLSNNLLSNLNLHNISMKSLKSLYLNNNNLSNITSAIPNSTEIVYLDISHNNITEIPKSVFKSFKELRILRAINNNIRYFNNSEMYFTTKLKDLNLSSNKISMIDLSFFKHLVSVDISNNIISYFNSTLLQDLDNLQVLNICNNNISVIPPGTFQHVRHLKFLNISSNNLKKIRYGSLKGLYNTEVIDLSRNNITEINVDVFDECKYLTKLIIDYNHIKYLDVDYLTKVTPNLISLSIGGNPIDCKEIVRNIKNKNETSVRSVEITSIHKIFHEDNVYGITCGDADSTTVAPVIPSSTPSISPVESSSLSTLIICFMVLTIFNILLVMTFMFWKHYYAATGTYPQTTIQFRRSLELSESELQSDLLN